MSEWAPIRCSSPRICSGDMYAGVPASLCPQTSVGEKSETKIFPDLSSRILPGWMSPCTIICRWASWRASATVATISALLVNDGRESRNLSARLVPSMNRQTTKQGYASVDPTSYTGTMFGWEMAAACRDFVRQATNWSGWAVSSGWVTLMATSRCICSSWAR